MAINVPYEQQVTPVTPVAPQIRVPDPVRAAYGENVAASQEGIANTIKGASETLTNHAIERLNQQREMDVYNGEMGLRDKANRLLFSTDMVTRNIDGKDVQVPEGIMNRKGSMANGAYDEFNTKYQQVSQEYINSYSTPQQKRLASFLSQRLNGYYSEQGSKHEATQKNIAFESDNINSQQSNIQLAAGTSDPKMIKSLMDSNENLQTLLSSHKGINPKIEGKGSIDATKAAILQSSIIGQVNGGNINGAYNLLNGFKDSVSPEAFKKLETMTNQSVKTLQAQDKIQTQQKTVDNRVQILQSVATGEINWKNAPNIATALEKRDPELGEAVQRVVDAKYKFTASNETGKDAVSDQSFEHILNNMIKQKDQVGITQMMVNDLNTHAGKISPTRLSLYVQAAMNRFGGLPLNAGDGHKINHDQEKVDAGLKSLIDWRTKNNVDHSEIYDSYLNDVHNKVDPKDAHDNAIKMFQIKQNPNAALMDNAVSVIVKEGSAQRYFMGKETDDSKFPYLYDEVNKRVIPNGNYKAKRSQEK